MFVVYAPAGINPAQISHHLDDIRENVQLVSPNAVTQELHVYGSR
jgi:hypothetical protein